MFSISALPFNLFFELSTENGEVCIIIEGVKLRIIQLAKGNWKSFFFLFFKMIGTKTVGFFYQTYNPLHFIHSYLRHEGHLYMTLAEFEYLDTEANNFMPFKNI